MTSRRDYSELNARELAVKYLYGSVGGMQAEVSLEELDRIKSEITEYVELMPSSFRVEFSRAVSSELERFANEERRNLGD